MSAATALLAARVRATPDAPAVCSGGETLDWAGLAARVVRRAEALRAGGVEPGDSVALLLENGLAFVECAHAVEACGATLLPLNLRWTAAELAHPLRDARPRLLVHGVASLAVRARAAGERAGTACVAIDALDAAPSSRASLALASDAPFALLYTSGTTGRPKGAVLTRRNVIASAQAAAFRLGCEPHDRTLACMPLAHVGGLSLLVRSVLGGTLLLVHERFEPEAVARVLRDEAVSQVSFVALMLARVLDAWGAGPPPPALRCALVGGGPAPEALLARARERGFPVAPSYGLTEAASQVATRPPQAPPTAGLPPLFGSELCIADAAGRRLGPGVEGEILVRGATVMRGYLGATDATARALAGGWLHTGDLGRLDAAGGLHVLARRSDLVVSGGENVYPAEVERVLEAHPAVAEAGVVGRRDPEFGERPVAFVVLRPGMAPVGAETLRAFCRERLAGYKVPAQVQCVAELPRDAAGKLVRRRLADSRYPAPAATE